MFIEIKNLSKIYNKYLAVDKINFHLEKDKTIGLLGPNGCGKTTTIGMMLGLVAPSSGEILIENKNLNSFRRDEILKRFNFASPYVELPKKLTVRQNLEIYGRLYGIKDLKKRIHEISNDLEIKEFFERKTGELSSGQKNRVSLAKSLINKPQVLLLDEPTASLDPDIGDFIRSYIQDYKNNKTRFIIVGNHDVSATKEDKTSVSIITKNKSGALSDILEKFKEQKINLTNIQSRPTKKNNWEYMFFIELDGHKTDKNVDIALKKISRLSINLKVLGSYPKGI